MSGTMVLAFAFLFGAVMGSFGNVLIWRLPREESIAWPESHCPSCSSPIRWFDNIPLASWLLLRGRCRSCHGRISLRYPAVELACALLFLAVAARFGVTFHSVVLALFCWALVVVTFIDLGHLLIPDAITFPGMAAGILAGALPGGPGVASSLLGLLLGYGLLLALAWAYRRIRRQEGMGMGDFKLLGMIGAVLGAGSLPVTILAASVAGSLAGLAAMAVTRRGLSLAIPFGPFLALGAIVHLFFGEALVGWYLSPGGGDKVGGKERVGGVEGRAVDPRTRPGLRREILLSLGVLILGAVFALGVAALAVSERLLLAQRRVALTQTALALGQALAEAGAAGGEAGLDRAVARMARELSLDSLVVTDPGGRVLASSRPGQKGTRVSDPALKLAWRVGGIVTPEEVEGRRPEPWRSWTFAAPLPGAGRGGETPAAGGFTATFSAVDVAWAVRWHRVMILLFAAADLAVILLFGNLLLGRVAVRPLQGLARASLAFAGGERGARAPVEGSREVACLAESFNEMADRVEEGLSRQQEQLAAITRANRELRAAQEELLRVEKLASVGRLASGVAHEIGNPLSAILGYTALLLREKPGGEAGEYLAFIERETERIRRIISDLLDFSRPSEVRVEELDLNGLVASALDLVRPQPDFREVAIVYAPGPGPEGEELPPVIADRHQITQVLVNLLLNSAQAMEGKGVVSVETSVWRAPSAGPPLPPRRRATDLPEGDGRLIPGVPAAPAGMRWVRITVRDEGPGIPPEAAGRLFDPFYTTKPPGKGTGLGLSLAWGIVAAHGGTIRAGSRGDGDRGAEFTVDLPAAR